MSLLSVRISKDLEKKLDEEARAARKKRAELVREALSAYLRARERERFLAEFFAEAKEAYADSTIRREAQKLAEEFLPLDNETLDIAEGRKPGEPWPEEQGKRWWR